MTAVLSEDEIDQLLTAINKGCPESEHFKYDPSIRRIKIYDFKRPDVLRKDQIRAMSSIHEFFARSITLNSSAKFRSCFHAHVASVNCLTYEEFIRSIPAPASLGLIELSPLKGCIAMEIDPNLSFPMIDLIFGGPGNEIKNKHELTLIEQAVIKSVFTDILEDLRNAWACIADLHPNLVRLETFPQFAQIVPPSEMSVMVTLEARIGDSKGMINIVYPFSVISPIAGKLCPFFLYDGKEDNHIRMRASGVKDSPYSSWEDIPVKLAAEVFRRDYSIKELINWKEETILLPLNPVIPNHCYLRLGERRVWQCKILEDQKWFLRKIEITGKAENPWGTEGRKMTFTQLDQDVSDALSAVKVTVTAELGTAEVPIKQLFGIGEGSIIELDAVAGELVDLKANGIIIARGEVVVIEEYFAIRVCEVVAKLNSDSSTVQFPPLKQTGEEPSDSAGATEAEGQA